MFKKLVLFCTCLLLLAFLTFTFNSSALVVTPSKNIAELTPYEISTIEESRSIVLPLLNDTVTPTALLNGESVELAKVFRDRQAALSEFIRAIPNVYESILSIMGARQVTSSNFNSFYQASKEFRQNKGDKISPLEIQECAYIDMFCDIYENDEYNNSILKEISKLEKNYSSAKEQEIRLSLPRGHGEP